MVSAQWVQIDSNPDVGTTEMCLAVSGSNLFAGTINGVFRSTDNGTNWTAVNSGLTNPFIHCLTVSGGNLFAGTYGGGGGGVFRSTNNGTRWTEVGSDFPGNREVYFLAVSGSTIFAQTNIAGTNSGGVFRSTDNGTSWTANGPTNNGVYVWSLAASGGTVFAGTDIGVFRSTDNGTNWTAVDSGLPMAGQMVIVDTFKVCDSTISARSCVDSSNNGTSWTVIVKNTVVRSFAVSGNNIFAGTQDYGVFLSTNNGTSWTSVNSGFPGSTWVNSFAVSGSNIFAATYGGVFLSTDSGTSWAGFNDGLPGWTVDGLAVGESYIFASVTAHAMHQIWRRPLSEIVGIINGKPQRGILKPYASGFKINISKNGIAVLLPQTLNNGAITVGLFTIAGKRIYAATYQAHNGILNIPISGLSTGTYLMSIRGNNTTLSSPFVVTK